eukprot:4673245-Amphidinium_carterae.1
MLFSYPTDNVLTGFVKHFDQISRFPQKSSKNMLTVLALICNAKTSANPDHIPHLSQRVAVFLETAGLAHQRYYYYRSGRA